MNAEQRKELEQVIAWLTNAGAAVAVISDDEQEKFDNLPEGLQDSEQGQAIEQTANQLDNIHSEINSLIERIEEI